MPDEDKAERIEDSTQFQSLERHADERNRNDARSDVIEAVPPLYMRGTIYLFVVVLIACLVLTYFAKVFVIVPVKGSILPEGQNVVVEAESAGIILKNLVTAGEKVTAGQVLMELRQEAADVDLKTLDDQLQIHEGNQKKAQDAIGAVNLILSKPRSAIDRPLDSFLNAGAAMVYIAGLRTAIQQLDQARQNQSEDLGRQRKTAASQIALQNATIASLERSQRTIANAIRTAEASLERKREDLARTTKLANDRVIPETQVGQASDRVLAAENAVNQHRQQLAQSLLQISQARVEIGNQEAQLSKQQSDLDNQLSSAQLGYDKALVDLGSSVASFEQVIRTTNAVISQARGKLRMQENTINNLTIKSPVDGEITTLSYNSAGQSVGAGSRVAVIVPTNARPVVFAIVANKDIAGIKEGLSARIKIDAYPFRQFGMINGTVTRVFPLADKPEFAVRLQLEKNYILVNGREETLEPGLTVQVDLLTERKRILELIFKKMSPN